MSRRDALSVNGRPVPIPVAWRGGRLLDFLRLELGLIGTKEGCGEGDCGACTVLVDGEPMCACLLPCGVVAGREITTVEGLGEAYLERFAAACAAHGGVQCGFCTPGLAVMGAWLASGGTETGGEPLAKLVEGNLCRCGAYPQLLESLDALR